MLVIKRGVYPKLTRLEIASLNDQILKQKVYKDFKHKTTTYLSEVTKIGSKYFGPKYKGTFLSDTIPTLSQEHPYCVLNLDNSNQSGSHWIAVALMPTNRYMVYDSFGRKSTTIIPSLIKKFGKGKIVDTDYDKEQSILETNCGQRALSWLVLVELFGFSNAKKL